MATPTTSLSIEPLPQYASHHSTDPSTSTSTSAAAETTQPLCGVFDPDTGCLLLGSTSGAISCLHLGRYGSSTARKLLGRHGGRVTGACLFPWQAPQHVVTSAAAAAAAASLSSSTNPTAAGQRAASNSFFATCSADATIKLWSSDPKALHTTDACLQTLRGHKAAVTCLAAAQVAHTWCLLSGAADGQLLLWRTASAPDAASSSSTGHQQQLSGAAMLSQLVPHMQLTETPLYASPHWILSIACPQQQTEAGAAQGAFVVLAQQPLLQVPISRSAVCDTATGLAAPAATAGGGGGQHSHQLLQAAHRSSTPSGGDRAPGRFASPLVGGGGVHALQQDTSVCLVATSATAGAAVAAHLQPSRLGAEAVNFALQQPQQQPQHKHGVAVQSVPAASGCSSSIAASPAACQRLQRPGSAGSSSYQSSNSSSWSGSAATACWREQPATTPSVSQVSGTQHLSMLAVAYVQQQMAVLTIAYDGACRLHSAVEGGTRCCWRSPTGTNYVAMDVCNSTGPQGLQIVLLGDDRGSLHMYSLASDKLMATKQVASGRISAVISCSHCRPPDSSSSSGNSGESSSSGSAGGGNCVQFAVLSEGGLGLWQLRFSNGSHGVVPGGHRQAVIALQLCATNMQVRAEDLLSTQQQQQHQQQQAGLAAPGLTKSASTNSSNSGSKTGGHPQPKYNRAFSSMHGSSSSSSSSGSNGGSSGSSHGSSMLFSAGVDGKVIQWDASGTTPAAVQSILASAGAAGGPELTAMVYLSCTSILVTGHDNGQLLLWHMDTGSHTVLGPQTHSNTVSCLSPVITAKGDEQLVSGGFDGLVCLWEPRQVRGVKPHLIARFQAHGCRPSSPGQFQLHNPQQQHQKHKHHHQQHSTLPRVQGSAMSCGSRPAAGSRAVGVTAQGKAVGGQQAIAPRPASGSRPASNNSSSQQHTPGSVAQPGNSSSSSSSLLLAAAASNECAPEVLAVLFDPINQVIITGGNDGHIKVWAGAASGLLLGQHVGHTGPINCLTLDGNLLFSGSLDTTIRMWDVLPPWFHNSGGVSGGGVSSGIATATAGLFGSSSSRPASPAYNGVSGSSSSPTKTHPTPPRFKPRDASSCRPASSTAFAVLRGHSAAVTGLAVAADSGVLVSCGADGQVLQWDYSNRQLLSKCCLQGQHLSGVAVEPDTRQVYVGTSQGQMLTVAGAEQACGGGGAAGGCGSSGAAPLVV